MNVAKLFIKKIIKKLINWADNLAVLKWTWFLNLVDLSVSVLVITCLGGQFVINCPSAVLKILKLPQ